MAKPLIMFWNNKINKEERLETRRELLELTKKTLELQTQINSLRGSLNRLRYGKTNQGEEEEDSPRPKTETSEIQDGFDELRKLNKQERL